ncbi:glycoside hydrolase [Niabella sp. CC-SYL272]|uniref:sialidase family protein n=1 Tax=Niabella agricola TaxID=2891571 RepID=UPI001F249C8E|nr:sialidase family protein [Niabella agricola]MCF3109650.1 glycoside hydrolase [Niabella agricola]
MKRYCKHGPVSSGLLTWTAFIGIMLLMGACSTRLQSGAVQTVTVFEPGVVYKSTRIPALVYTKQGSLLAFCEGRIGTASDWADMHLVMRRSTDGGKSWEPVIIIDSMKGGPAGNPTPIVGADGTIHLLYQRDYAEGFYTCSTDDGKTWSKSVNITATYNAFRSDYNWKVLAPGPGHGIQLKNGRLLSAVWLANSSRLTPRRSHSPSCVATIYSDDYGKTWERGAIIADSSLKISNPNESMPVQLSDGSVLMSIRNPSKQQRRAFSSSVTGTGGWTAAQFADDLFDPTCMAPIIALPTLKPQGKPALLFVNPDSRDIEKHPRRNLSAKLSFDEGASWSFNKVIDAGPSGYSDLAVDKKGTVYCLYESASKDRDFNYRLVLKKLPAKWFRKN